MNESTVRLQQFPHSESPPVRFRFDRNAFLLGELQGSCKEPNIAIGFRLG